MEISWNHDKNIYIYIYIYLYLFIELFKYIYNYIYIYIHTYTYNEIYIYPYAPCMAYGNVGSELQWEVNICKYTEKQFR